MNNVKQGQTGSNKVPWTAGPWQRSLACEVKGKSPPYNVWTIIGNTSDDERRHSVVATTITDDDNARLIAASPCLAAFVAAIAGSVKCSESESGKAAPEAVDGWIDHARALLARLEGKE